VEEMSILLQINHSLLYSFWIVNGGESKIILLFVHILDHAQLANEKIIFYFSRIVFHLEIKEIYSNPEFIDS
jgi:hypothetical protein